MTLFMRSGLALLTGFVMFAGSHSASATVIIDDFSFLQEADTGNVTMPATVTITEPGPIVGTDPGLFERSITSTLTSAAPMGFSRITTTIGAGALSYVSGANEKGTFDVVYDYSSSISFAGQQFVTALGSADATAAIGPSTLTLMITGGGSSASSSFDITSTAYNPTFQLSDFVGVDLTDITQIKLSGDIAAGGTITLFEPFEATVPEPASVAVWSLACVGLVGGVIRKRRKK